MVPAKNIYIIDSSSLIDLKRYYPMDVFKGIWNNFNTLIKNKSLISSIEVFNEISRRDDELTNWAKQHLNIFRPITRSITQKVREILAKFPELIDVNKDTPDADPFIIALALEADLQQTLTPITRQKIIITEEKYKENKLNIPSVCRIYKIECINLLQLFRKEGWAF